MLTIDAALTPLQHGRQEGPDDPVHAADIQVEGEVPVLLAAVQDRAVMNIAGAVHQDIDGAHFGGQRLDRLRVEHVERTDRQTFGPLQFGKLFQIDIGGDDLCALTRESEGRGAADALCRRRHKGGLAGQSHCLLPLRNRVHPRSGCSGSVVSSGINLSPGVFGIRTVSPAQTGMSTLQMSQDEQAVHLLATYRPDGMLAP